MNDTISRQAAIDAVQKAKDKSEAHRMLIQLPTVDVVPVRRGRWIDCDTQCGISCSVCGTPVDDFCHSIDYIDLEYKPNFCPNCGADMRKDGEQE